MRYYMGIDVGTYESKGVLCDESLNIVASHSEKHGMENPAPGFFEHDAEVVWWGGLFVKYRERCCKGPG